MSKKPIFADAKTGGRKANLLSSMVKKTEASLLNLDKNQTSPFSGYSFASNQLAVSQVTNGFAVSNTSIENMKGTIQEEVEKCVSRALNERLPKLFSERDKQHEGVIEEIQKIHKSLDGVVKGYEEKNKELFNTFQTARIRHDQTTLQNLKIFIGLMKEELTKEFVPMQLLEELELVKLLENYQDRLEVLEKQPRGGNDRRGVSEDTVLSKEIELNLGKTMREIESLKKTMTTLSEQKNVLKSQILGINKSIVDITMRNDQQASKIDVIAKQTNEELSSQLAKLREQIDDNSHKLTKSMDELKNAPTTLSKLKSVESEPERPEDFKLDDKSITQSMDIAEGIDFKSNLDAPIKVSLPTSNVQLTKSDEPTRTSQNLYQIDGQGLLMDEFGQYIQDAENNFIMLTEQQIAALKESNMLIE